LGGKGHSEKSIHLMTNEQFPFMMSTKFKTMRNASAHIFFGTTTHVRDEVCE
jgi:hypothetical protein